MSSILPHNGAVWCNPKAVSNLTGEMEKQWQRIFTLKVVIVALPPPHSPSHNRTYKQMSFICTARKQFSHLDKNCFPPACVCAEVSEVFLTICVCTGLPTHAQRWLLGKIQTFTIFMHSQMCQRALLGPKGQATFPVHIFLEMAEEEIGAVHPQAGDWNVSKREICCQAHQGTPLKMYWRSHQSRR